MSLLEKIVRNPSEYNLNIYTELVNEIPNDAFGLIMSRTKTTDKESIVYLCSVLIPNKYENYNLDLYWIYPSEDPTTIYGIERYGNKSININSLCMNRYEFKNFMNARIEVH